MNEWQKNVREQVFESFSAQDTFDFGAKLGEQCTGGEIFLLDGELGTGKTVFSKGFGKGLGVEEPISSPTFTILNIYENGRLPFYHFDVYRISDIEEMDEIGYEDYFYGRGVCLVEWAELVKELLPESCTQIRIEKDLTKGVDYRRIFLRSWMSNLSE